MVYDNVLKRARNALAEFGFEHTLDELREDDDAMKVLETWQKPKNLKRLRKLADKLGDAVEKGVIYDMPSLKRKMEKLLKQDLTEKDFAAWVSLLDVFRDHL